MRTVQSFGGRLASPCNRPTDQLIVLDNTDELGQVVRSFNHVAAALFKANQDITELNRRLEAENLRMGAGTAVTRRLQEMILPKSWNSRPFRAWRSLALCNRPPK